MYRSWCRHCVASKGRAHAHSSREDGELPEIGIDCGFFGRDRDDVLQIVCQVSEQFNCMHGSDSDCQEGSVGSREFIFDSIHQEVLGFKTILVRSDNERSLSTLIDRVTYTLTGVELVLMDVSRR